MSWADDTDRNTTRPIDELAALRARHYTAPADGGVQLPLVLRSEELSGPEVSSYGPLVVDKLRLATRPIPGRDGWRIDSAGVEWYSSAWIGLLE